MNHTENTQEPRAAVSRLDDQLSAINAQRLAGYLLDQPWHRNCEIIPDYMPPFPDKNTRPSVKVRYNDGSEYPPFLRYSQGPKQGFFWDVYGDDMQDLELAIIALSRAPAPVSVGPIVVSIPLGT
jgi:hypothetical protein